MISISSEACTILAYYKIVLYIPVCTCPYVIIYIYYTNSTNFVIEFQQEEIWRKSKE